MIVTRSSLALLACVLLAGPAGAQPAPASPPAAVLAATSAAADFAAADFATLDASDDVFEPRPAEQLTGPFSPSSGGLRVEVGADRRTLGRFIPNLGRNLVGVVTRDNLRPFLVGAAAAGGGALLDTRVQRYFGGEARWPALGRAGRKLGEPRNTTLAAAALFGAGRFARGARVRAASYDLAQAFLVNAAWTGALKYTVRRERPDGSSRLSFPSGHTSNAFAWATVADHHYGHRLGVAAYAAAGLIGLSRVEANVHYLSDVLAGATLGYVVGRTVVRENGKAPRGRRRFALTPTTDAGGHGVGLALSGEFSTRRPKYTRRRKS